MGVSHLVHTLGDHIPLFFVRVELRFRIVRAECDAARRVTVLVPQLCLRDEIPTLSERQENGNEVDALFIIVEALLSLLATLFPPDALRPP